MEKKNSAGGHRKKCQEQNDFCDASKVHDHEDTLNMWTTKTSAGMASKNFAKGEVTEKDRYSLEQAQINYLKPANQCAKVLQSSPQNYGIYVFAFSGL